jgi:hypothetical protein
MAHPGKSRVPAVRYYGQRGRGIREVKHPLPPELIVAEFAGELPPDVASAVRHHVASCDSCGARATTLAAPYDLLGTLGAVPVNHVPDLRRRVRERTMRPPFLTRARRAAAALGRGGLASLTVLGAVVLIGSLIIITDTLRAPALSAPDANQLGAVPPAGSKGVVLADTGNVVGMGGADNHGWYLPQVLVINQRTGRVVRTLPSQGRGFQPGAPGQLPAAVALSRDGRTVYVLAADGHGRVALAALNVADGSVLYITPVATPGVNPPAQGIHAVSLALAPDGSQVYIGVAMGPGGVAAPRVVVARARDGQMQRTITATLPHSVLEPAPASLLPGVGSTTPATTLATAGLNPSLAAGGAVFISPDGQFLLDAVLLADATGPQAIVCRRISLATGDTQSALALPGDFGLSALAVSPDGSRPYLFVVRVGANGQAYMLDASAPALGLVAQIPLGGPSYLAGQTLHGSVTMSVAVDGSRVYISDDYAPETYQLGGHDTWLLDAASGSIVAHRFAFTEAGAALANWQGGADGQLLVLLGGQIAVMAPDLNSPNGPRLWFALAGGDPIVHLIGTAP